MVRCLATLLLLTAVACSEAPEPQRVASVPPARFAIESLASTLDSLAPSFIREMSASGYLLVPFSADSVARTGVAPSPVNLARKRLYKATIVFEVGLPPSGDSADTIFFRIDLASRGGHEWMLIVENGHPVAQPLGFQGEPTERYPRLVEDVFLRVFRLKVEQDEWQALVFADIPAPPVDREVVNPSTR